MYFFDTETCGLHGPTVLIQYADGPDGEVLRHNVFRETIFDTLQLIERLVEEGVCGFNLAFDWFHICQTYTVLSLLGENVGFDEYPWDYIDTYAELESLGRDGLCLKPRHALDLMLHARKGPYQSTMDRKNIKIKRVPVQLANPLIIELNKRIPLKDIYFERQQDKKKRWTINQIKKADGETDKDFVNIELKFRPSSALKALAVDALNKEVLLFKDVGVDRKFNPIEVGWAPFAIAISSKDKNWYAKVKIKGQVKEGRAWPGVIKKHINHWAFDTKAIAYSNDDVIYVQELYKYFGAPTNDDNDSVLACMAGAVRWRGFAVDLELLKKLVAKADTREAAAPKHSEHVRKYLMEVLSPAEQAAIKESTKKTVLESTSKLLIDCPTCHAAEGGCSSCGGTGAIRHPAAIRAEKCLDARKARFDRTLFNKLIQAGRFHVSAKIIGSLSSRMTSGDGMNALGIQHLKEIRKCFTMAFGDLKLCGGDFAAFEVSIADADYDDPQLRKQLTTCWVCKQQRNLTNEELDSLYCPRCGRAEDKCSNCKKLVFVYQDGCREECDCGDCKLKDEPEVTTRKLHGLFGMQLAPGKSYEEILATKGKDPDLYDQGKRGGFSQFYGGNWNTLVNRLGVTEEVAKAAEYGFATEYQGVGRAKQRNYDNFCSMRQLDQIGHGAITWSEPKEYAESLNGFRRYFTLENNICRELFNLANDPPEEWGQIKITCVRRDRDQKIGGAVRSAVFAAAFQIQSHNMRAAQNHRIQSTGAIETKDLQCKLWELQPYGIKKWSIQPMNVHDELITPCLPELKPTVRSIVIDFVHERRKIIPLLKMDFVSEMDTWADKG